MSFGLDQIGDAFQNIQQTVTQVTEDLEKVGETFSQVLSLFDPGSSGVGEK